MSGGYLVNIAFAADIEKALFGTSKIMNIMAELSTNIGRTFLDAYLRMPWYRRLWHDIRIGRFERNVSEAIMEALR